MDFDLSDDQKMLRDQAIRVVFDRVGPGVLRALVDDGQIWSEPLFRELAELGFYGLTIPEIYGGLELSELDLAVVAEALGRGPVPVPFSSSICLAAEAIRLGGSELQKERWLPLLATGKIIGTVALHDEVRALDQMPIPTRYEDGYISGTKSPVPDAGLADIVVVAAASANGNVLAIVERDASDQAVTALRGMDKLRPHSRITYSGTKADLLSGEDASTVMDAVIQRAATYVAFEQIGGAEACLTMARHYALDRRVFGQPIGTYQAIKHKLADMLTEIEIARSNAFYAGWAASNNPAELPAAAAGARLTATTAYEFAARENVHIHGGIGYTWEGDCQFHHARSRLLALSLGGTSYWSDRLIGALAPDWSQETFSQMLR